MSLTLIVIVVLLVLLLGSTPRVSGHPYGYLPAGGLGLVLLIVLILLLLGRL